MYPRSSSKFPSLGVFALLALPNIGLYKKVQLKGNDIVCDNKRRTITNKQYFKTDFSHGGKLNRKESSLLCMCFEVYCKEIKQTFHSDATKHICVNCLIMLHRRLRRKLISRAFTLLLHSATCSSTALYILGQNFCRHLKSGTP